MQHKERRLLQYVMLVFGVTRAFYRVLILCCFFCRFPQEFVYHTVASVENYKYFVPWCFESNIIRRDANYFEAELAVGFQLFSERYISRVTLVPNERVSARALSTELFHYLYNDWILSPGPSQNTCWLTCQIGFQFRSVLYAQVSHMFFNEVVSRMVTAFEKRCIETYPTYLEEEKKKEREFLASGADLSLQTSPPVAPAEPMSEHSPVELIANRAPRVVAKGLLLDVVSAPQAAISTKSKDSSQIHPTTIVGIKNIVMPSRTKPLIDVQSQNVLSGLKTTKAAPASQSKKIVRKTTPLRDGIWY